MRTGGAGAGESVAVHVGVKVRRGAAAGGLAGVRMARRGVVAALLSMAVALSGCQTTAEKSAALAKRFHRQTVTQHGLSIARVSREVKVLEATVVHDANGTAAVVTLRNDASRALREVPIAIALKTPGGRVVYQNDAPGLDPSLTSTSLAAHQTFTWVNDQVGASAFPATVLARAGEAPVGPTHPPRLDTQGVRLVEDPANGTVAEGTVVNRSAVTQQNVVVFAVARRNGKVVAAGRALLATVPQGGSSPFQIFFIGNPSGGKLEVNVPATTFS